MSNLTDADLERLIREWRRLYQVERHREAALSQFQEAMYALLIEVQDLRKRVRALEAAIKTGLKSPED